MSTDNTAGSAPHLKDIHELYQKVRELDDIELKYDYSSLEDNYHCYVHEDIDTVLNNFAELFSVPSEQLEPVRDAMRSGIIDFMLLPQGEVASFSTPVSLEELRSLLYVISRNFFRSMKKSLNVDNIFWEEGKCPVCNAVPSLSMLEEGDKRKYYCSFCETVGYYKRIGCPCCQSEDPKLADIIFVGNDSDMRVDVCNQCKSYVKTIDLSKTAPRSIEEADLSSLHLDIIAQGKGYERKSPNPVGMQRAD